MNLSLIPGLDLIGSLLDWAKYASYLAWAVGHPSTAMWLIGAILLLGVMSNRWIFKNVPSVDTFLGKALTVFSMCLILGGFTWRALDAYMEMPRERPASHQRSNVQTPISPARPDFSKISGGGG